MKANRLLIEKFSIFVLEMNELLITYKVVCFSFMYIWTNTRKMLYIFMIWVFVYIIRMNGSANIKWSNWKNKQEKSPYILLCTRAHFINKHFCFPKTRLMMIHRSMLYLIIFGTHWITDSSMDQTKNTSGCLYTVFDETYTEKYNNHFLFLYTYWVCFLWNWIRRN